MVRPREPLFDKENETWFYIDCDNNIHKSKEYFYLVSHYATDLKQYCDYLENLISYHSDDDDESPWVFK